MPDNRSQDEAVLKWVQNWRKAGAAIERVRAAELRAIDVPAAIERLQDAFQSAQAHYPARAGSGLVEQQRWFKTFRK